MTVLAAVSQTTVRLGRNRAAFGCRSGDTRLASRQVWRTAIGVGNESVDGLRDRMEAQCLV